MRFDKRKDHPKESGPPREAMNMTVERQPPPPPPPASTEQRSPAAKAIIGATIVIKGELSGDEDIVIAGEFEGSIDLPNHRLTIVDRGQVRADIKANTVEIQGEVQGDVDGVDKVLITKTGRMQGNITSPRVILDDGAIFKGRIDMEPVQIPQSTPAPRPKQAAAGTVPKAASTAAPTVAPKQAAQPVQRSGNTS